MPIAAGNGVTTTELQQSIFGARPSSLPIPLAQNSKVTVISTGHGGMDVDREEVGPKGVKREREEESDEEGVPMEEDSDAPMEASSDDDD